MAKGLKGAIKQRDGEKYSLRFGSTNGVLTADALEALAKVAREKDAVIKITSGQRIAVKDLSEDDILPVCDALPLTPGGFYTQVCPGDEYCKFGAQDSMEMAREIDEKFSTVAVPAKLKFAVSGCKLNCAEAYVRDIGLIGTKKGWTVLVGGNSGTTSRIADVLAEDMTREDAFDLVDRFVAYYQENGEKKRRTSKFVDGLGIEKIREDLSV